MAKDPSDHDLAPLPTDLAPEVQQLAEFLRANFLQLGVSVRTYAARVNWDPGTLSRFLSGRRIPPQAFIDRLLADAYPQRPPTQEQVERKRASTLRLEALQVRNARAAESERLTQELGDAEEEIRLLQVKERELAKALVRAEDEHASLWEKYQEMRAAQARQLDGPLQIETRQNITRLAEERDHAQDEIQRLESELFQERAARIEAERRREVLQAQLEKAHYELTMAGGGTLFPEGHEPRAQLLAVLRDRRTRWGGLISIVAVPVAIYGVPIYLGLVYHLLTHSEEIPKVLTICGLLIPLWFGVGVRKVKQSAARGNARSFVLLVAVTTTLFFVAALI